MTNNNMMNYRPLHQSYPLPPIPNNMNPTKKDTKTYAKAAGKSRNTLQNNTQVSFIANLKSVPTMVRWNNSTLIGEVLNIDILTTITKLIKADGN